MSQFEWRILEACDRQLSSFIGTWEQICIPDVTKSLDTLAGACGNC